MQKPKRPKIGIPPGTPEWITEEDIAETLRVWRRYSKERLTADDAIEILTNVDQLLRLLVEIPGRQK